MDTHPCHTASLSTRVAPLGPLLPNPSPVDALLACPTRNDDNDNPQQPTPHIRPVHRSLRPSSTANAMLPRHVLPCPILVDFRSGQSVNDGRSRQRVLSVVFVVLRCYHRQFGGCAGILSQGDVPCVSSLRGQPGRED